MRMMTELASAVWIEGMEKQDRGREDATATRRPGGSATPAPRNHESRHEPGSPTTVCFDVFVKSLIASL